LSSSKPDDYSFSLIFEDKGEESPNTYYRASLSFRVQIFNFQLSIFKYFEKLRIKREVAAKCDNIRAVANSNRE